MTFFLNNIADIYSRPLDLFKSHRTDTNSSDSSHDLPKFYCHQSTLKIDYPSILSAVDLLKTNFYFSNILKKMSKLRDYFISLHL